MYLCERVCVRVCDYTCVCMYICIYKYLRIFITFSHSTCHIVTCDRSHCDVLYIAFLTYSRSHFDHRAWIAYLRDDKVAQEWFSKGVVFCNDTSTDANGALRSLMSEHVREHVIKGVSENDPKEVLMFFILIVEDFF